MNSTAYNANDGADLKDSYSTKFGGDCAGEQGTEESASKEQAIRARDDGVCPTVAWRCGIGFKVKTRVQRWLPKSSNDHGQSVSAEQRAEGRKKYSLERHVS